MPSIHDLAGIIMGLRAPQGPLVVGVTGGVASGKSTLAGDLARVVEAAPDAPRVEHIGTDGFLYANSVLAERGLLERKGYPESYDAQALHAALRQVRRRATRFPGYSHRLYDIDPALGRTIEPPDVLIIEGLGLDARAPLDTLVYLHAEEADQEAWFVRRFLQFWEQGRTDPSSFYARFADLDDQAASGLASRVWTSINRPNLREHIAPIRSQADVVVVKGSDHRILAIRRRGEGD